jgi:hypothetical protein
MRREASRRVVSDVCVHGLLPCSSRDRDLPGESAGHAAGAVHENHSPAGIGPASVSAWSAVSARRDGSLWQRISLASAVCAIARFCG